MPCYDPPRSEFWYMTRECLEYSTGSLLQHHFEIEKECEKLREWTKFVIPLLKSLAITVPETPKETEKWENLFTYQKAEKFYEKIPQNTGRISFDLPPRLKKK